MAQAYELLDLVDASPEALYDLFEERGWGDGLPLVPPTSARVDAMLDGCGGDPDEVLAVLPPRFGKATRRIVAVNAVLAGCKPEYLPVLVTADACARPTEVNLRGVNATTHPVAPLLIVHGEIAERAGYNSGLGAFGPGNRANATTGRALRLVLLHVAGAVPGPGDASTQGGPAKYAYCVAENLAATPWEGFHRSRRRRRRRPRSPCTAAKRRTTSTTWSRDHPSRILDKCRVGDGDDGPEQRLHRAGRVLRRALPRARCDLRVGADGRVATSSSYLFHMARLPVAWSGHTSTRWRGPPGCTAWPTTRCCR